MGETIEGRMKIGGLTLDYNTDVKTGWYWQRKRLREYKEASPAQSYPETNSGLFSLQRILLSDVGLGNVSC